MRQRPSYFTPEEYETLKEVLLELGKRGRFEADDLFVAYVEQGRQAGPVNPGSVGQILEDLSDLEVVRQVKPRRAGGPVMYEVI